MYYQVDINKIDYSYKVYFFNGTKSVDRYGRTCLPIQFYERGGGTFTKPTYNCTSFVPPPTPNPTLTPTPTISLTPTPTPTPTPAGNGGGDGGTEVPVFVYYRAGEVMDTNLSTTYCNGFGMNGQGYTINSPFYTTDAMLIPGTTTIYSDPNLSNKIVGSWSVTNVTRMAYMTQSERQNAGGIPTTTNPDGDSLYDGGTYKFMRVNSDGVVMSTGTSYCTSGGGGGGGTFTE